MKKRTILNMVMVAVIVLIAASGLLGVGYIQGWFDATDGTQTVLQEIVGVVNMERSGVNYTVERATALRPGDQITTQKGATAVISMGADRITLGGGTQVTVTDPNGKNISLHVVTGQLFVNTTQPVSLTFEGEQVQIADATVALSVRTGAQTLQVFRGSVGDVTEGKAAEYVTGERTVGKMQLEALDDFLLTQIRKANESTVLCYTDRELDALEEKRRQEIQDLLDGVTRPTDHEHDFDVRVVPPSCTVGGYTEHFCSCGESYSDNETAPTGHHFGQWMLVKAATEQESGLMERTCQDCGEKESQTVPPVEVGHSHVYTATVVAPTCTVKGYTLHLCACGESYRDNETEALGHHYESKVVEPTCTAKGYTLYCCACGENYTDNVKNAQGHSWGDWETIKQATDKENGLQERVCKVCKAREEATIPAKQIAGYVTITIRCDTILDNMETLTPGKAGFVPANGEILPLVQVPFYEKETVLDVLLRVCDTASIQMEYSWSPIYGSAYVEGINNLYEFDCGSESGWMYKVNGWFPNYGVSNYPLSNGDAIVFAYSCKGLGMDVGAPEWEGD